VGPAFTVPVKCGQEGCLQTFRYSLALKRHIENKHNDSPHNDGDNEGDADTNPFEINPNNNTPCLPHNVETVLSKNEITEFAASAIAKLKASSSMVQSHIDHVVHESSELFSNVVMSLKTKTEQMLDNKDIEKDDPERIELLEAFDNAQCPYENLETAYQQEKYFHQSGHFIKPREVPFATAFYPRHNPVTNHVDQVARHVTFQYIPLKDLLKHILENKRFMRAIQQYQPSRDGIMRDFHDGEFCRGLHISTDVFEGDVHVGIAQVTGDNLGLNGICGFIESFVGHHCCRTCKMHLVEMHRALTANSDMLRDHDNYTEDLDLNDSSSTGIKAPCLLNDVEHFHVTTNYAPDVMHDLWKELLVWKFI
jgi:hypothetical protein